MTQRAGDRLIRNSRFFLRPIEDISAGGMSSVHSRISLKGKKLRGEIILRDCNNEISFEFWSGEGAKPGGRKRMRDAVGKLQDELTAFMIDYERAAREINE